MPFRLPSFPASFRSLLAVAAPLALASSACTTAAATTNTTTADDSSGYATALLLRPNAFIGDTPCGLADGAMRSYVATLISEETDPASGKTYKFMSSSIPVSCSEGVRWDEVVSGKPYWVEIDGYEKLATDIGPEDWMKSDGTINYAKLHSGSRHMDNRIGLPVAPRWFGSCGTGEHDPILAAASGTTLVLGCDPLEDLDPAKGMTAVEIDPRDALGTLACEGEGSGGQPTVAAFDVASANGLDNQLGEKACSKDEAAFTVTGAALVPGEGVSFYVGARAAVGGPLSWGATCSAIVEEGLTVHAACAPLTAEGSLEIDFAGVLAQYGLLCGADFATYDAVVTAGDQAFEDTGLACEKPRVYKPLKPGDYTADLSVTTKGGDQVFAVTCTGTIEPGRTNTITSCTQQ